MGNNLCCFGPHDVERDDLLIEEDALQNTHMESQNSEDEFAQIEIPSDVSDLDVADDLLNVQDVRLYHRQDSNQEPKHVDSLSEEEKIDIEDKGVVETGDQELSPLDDIEDSTDDSISALEEGFVLNQLKEENLSHRGKDKGSYQHQRKSSSQISLQVQTLEVSGAGSAAVNGVYRWFAAHGRFVMFTDQGQYQIMGGVNLSDYGERYFNSWVIQEITGAQLYAVDSGHNASISCDGWICINGASPAPQVKVGNETELEDDDYDIETEESESSISHLPAAYLPKEWVAANNIDDMEAIDGVLWVD